MDLSDATEPRIVSVEAHRDDALQIVESAMGTVAAANRFIANFERVKEERDRFERQLADARAENEKLRRNINDGEGRYDHLAKSVTKLTDQMESIGVRCLEAVKVVRAQIDPAAPIQLGLPALHDQAPTKPTAIPSPPIAPPHLTDDGSSPEQGAQEQGVQPNNSDGRSRRINEASRVIQVFGQYLTQPARVT